jgi:hypothetical protein
VELSDQTNDGKSTGKPTNEKTNLPPGIPKEIRDKWNTYPPELQQSFAKLVKENADARAAAGRNVHLREMEEVIRPYMPGFKQLGATPAKFVEAGLRLLNRLGNEQTRVQAFEELMNSYGIDPYTIDWSENTDPRTKRITEVESRLTRFEAHQQAQQKAVLDQHAQKYVSDWAKDKPHLDKVRQQIVQLCINDPMFIAANGELNITLAYEAACDAAGLDPYPTNKQTQQKQKSHRNNRHNNNKQRNNHKQQSVRDSLRSAIQEHKQA